MTEPFKRPEIYIPTMEEQLQGFQNNIRVITSLIAKETTDTTELGYIYFNRKFLEAAMGWKVVKENMTDFTSWQSAIDAATAYLTKHSYTPPDSLAQFELEDPTPPKQPV
jgi:hypothetical protein